MAKTTPYIVNSQEEVPCTTMDSSLTIYSMSAKQLAKHNHAKPISSLIRIGSRAQITTSGLASHVTLGYG
jgi:hypothetical protein